MRYFFTTDSDGHWHMIPEELHGHWQWIQGIQNEERRDELIEQEFAKYYISNIEHITFTDPKEREN